MSAFHQPIIKGLLLAIFSLFFVSISQAAVNPSIQNPDDLVHEATTKMIRSINENRAAIKKSPDKLKSLVEEIILPHLDFISASKAVMGKYWRRAKKPQKIQFIRQFRLLLLRFYSSALAEYLNGNDKKLSEDLIRYFPIKVKNGEKAITVRAEIQSDTGPAIPMRYRMNLTKKGWKIYDVSVEGVSMITTYKNNFATQFKSQGIDSVIASLVEKNQQMLADNGKSANDKQN